MQTDNQPTESVSHGLENRFYIPQWVWPVAGLSVVVFTCIAVMLAATAVDRASKRFSNEISLLRKENKKFADENNEELRKIAYGINDIDISVPPTNDKLFTILSKGVGVTEDSVRTTTVGVVPSAAFA